MIRLDNGDFPPPLQPQCRSLARIYAIVAKVKRGADFEETWNVRRSTKYRSGDRLYILKVGKGQSGIMGTGFFTRWVDEKRIGFKYESLLNPNKNENVLPREMLTTIAKDMYWYPRASGTKLPDKMAKIVYPLWQRHLERIGVRFIPSCAIIEYPEEQIDCFPMGSPRKVTINVYERNPTARNACIDYYGACCRVCECDFGDRYGVIGQGFIHVHHLKAVSKIKVGYKIRPTKDLIPVCPNCHAMLHSKEPPFTVKELRKRLR